MNISGKLANSSPGKETLSVYDCGTVARGGAIFTVKRMISREGGVEKSVKTKLISSRGNTYILSANDNGSHTMRSFNTGKLYRADGTTVKVQEIDGIVTFLN